MYEALLLLAVLLIVLLASIIILLFKYFRLQSQVSDIAHGRFTEWRNRELGAVRDQLQFAAQSEARALLSQWQLESEAGIRSDAVRRSSAVVVGKVSEHLAPYMGAFPYNPKDVRFLGSPIDLVVFDGMNEDNLQEIVFLEIKTNTSSLTPRERKIRDAVLAKRVSWKEFRIGGG